MKLLREALLDGCFLLDLDERDMPSVFRQVLNYLVARGTVIATQREELEASLLSREELVSTAIGHAVAVPHTYMDAVREPVIVFVRLEHAQNMGAPDGIPTRFIFVLLGPTGAAAQHLDSLANIARLMADEEFRYDAGIAPTQLDIMKALDRFDARMAPAPTLKQEQPDELTYSGRLFGGLVEDIRRRLPHFASDFASAFCQRL